MRLITIVFLLVFSLAVFAAEEINYQNQTDDIYHLGSTLFPGDFYDILYFNGYVWVADGLQSYSGNLKVIDVSDPANPVVAATMSFPGEIVFRLDGYNDMVFVSIQQYGIVIVDASDPLNPQVLGEYSSIYTVNDMDVVGELLFAMRGAVGTEVLDISDPGDIRTIATISGNGYSVAVSEDTLVGIAAYTNGLRIYDAGDLTNIELLETLTITSRAFHDVVYDDGYFYGAHRSTFVNSGGFAIADANDPGNISLLSQPVIFGADGFPDVGIDVTGDTLFYCGGQTGLKIFDITDPESPVQFGTFGAGTPYPPAVGNWQTRVTYGDGHAYTISHDRQDWYQFNRLLVMNIDDITDPEPMGFFDTPAYLAGVDVDGNFAYVGGRRDGIYIMDISDPENLEVASNLDFDYLGYSGVNVIHEDGLIYYNGAELSLGIGDVSDPFNPVIVSEYTDGMNHYSGIDKEFNIVAVCAWGVSPMPPGWIEIYEVTDPSNPIQVSTLLTDGHPEDIIIEGSFAYIAYDDGLGVIDIENASVPALIGSISTGSGAHSVEAEGDVAYAADESGDLYSIDVTDPYNLSVISRIALSDYGRDMEISGDSLYVVTGGSMVIVNISDPADLAVDDEIGIDGNGKGIAVDGGNICVADYYGFHVFSTTATGIVDDLNDVDLMPVWEVSAYPNPFNPSTVIGFELRDAGFVSVNVFNITGRQVRVQQAAPLQRQWMTSGYHEIVWDASGVASGVYFIQLSVDSRESQAIKVMLVK